MILDLPRFIATERGAWTELEQMLDRLESAAAHRLTLDQAKRLHFLHQKVAADLAKLATFASEPELRRYLESLTARAYAEIHDVRERQRFRPWRWFTREFPRAFRRRGAAFALSLAISLAGALFGSVAVMVDPEGKEAIIPAQFAAHLGDPSARVRREEAGVNEDLQQSHQSFAGQLMVNNISVSIRALAFGMTYGVLTIIVLFFNGVLVGVIALDYIRAGEGVFLAAWLLPHGSIELPAVFIAGQAGLVLASALIGWGDRNPLRTRLRLIAADLMTLIGGVAVMLVWAGVIESFVSQYHAPVLPYWVKITFGLIELAALVWFLGWCGKAAAKGEKEGGAATASART